MPKIIDELAEKIERRKARGLWVSLAYFLLPCWLVGHDWADSFGFRMCARCAKSDRDEIKAEQLRRINGRTD